MSGLQIGFNKPYTSGKEFEYIAEAVSSKHLSGNGKFTKACQEYLAKKYGFHKCLLTTSCTDALEMAAILINIQPGDEVIMPSYTFVSTANAFVLFGAKIVFVDSGEENPNIDAGRLEQLITKKTKAIVAVHYAGIACDMDTIMDIAERHNLFVIEDAAQAIDSFHTGKNGKKALGSIGHLAAFSFHETKNIISGEGGMLVVNDTRFEKRSEIIWEKGTNRCSFYRNEVDKYGWVDIGSSFLPSEITAAFLLAQLEAIEDIQATRKKHWERYYTGLNNLNDIFRVPYVPPYATNNAHMFYLVCKDLNTRSGIIQKLRSAEIHTVFHYQSLHKSPYYLEKHDGRPLPWSDLYSDTVLRLPMFYELMETEIDRIIENIGLIKNKL
jgi:dTDP-4-amino-4,6-dideoxygalactose transaminase